MRAGSRTGNVHNHVSPDIPVPAPAGPNTDILPEKYLDDFGTGYSNFDRILSLKLDVVKFDRSLLLMADQDANSRFMLDYFSTAFERLLFLILRNFAAEF